MNCETAREAISAQLDGETPGCDPSTLDEHIASCPECRAWRERAHEITRRARLVSAEPVPPPGDRLFALLRASGGHGRWRSPELARAALIVVAAAQVLITVPALLLGSDHDAPIHVAHEMGSFEMALAIGFLAAAWRPARARGMVVIVGCAVLLLLITAAVDLASGRTSFGEESPHLLALAGWLLLCRLAALGPPAGDERPLPMRASGLAREWFAMAREVHEGARPSASPRDATGPIAVQVDEPFGEPAVARRRAASG